MRYLGAIELRRFGLIFMAAAGISLAISSYVGLEAFGGGDGERAPTNTARVVAILTDDASLETSSEALRSVGFDVRAEVEYIESLHAGMIDVLMVDRSVASNATAQAEIVRLYGNGVAIAGIGMSMRDLLEFLPDSPEPPDERDQGNSVNDAWTDLPPDIAVFAITKVVGDCTGATFTRLPDHDGLRVLADKYAQLCEK